EGGRAMGRSWRLKFGSWTKSECAADVANSIELELPVNIISVEACGLFPHGRCAWEQRLARRAAGVSSKIVASFRSHLQYMPPLGSSYLWRTTPPCRGLRSLNGSSAPLPPSGLPSISTNS